MGNFLNLSANIVVVEKKAVAFLDSCISLQSFMKIHNRISLQNKYTTSQIIVAGVAKPDICSAANLCWTERAHTQYRYLNGVVFWG